MPKQAINVLSRKTILHKAIFRIDQVDFTHQMRDGRTSAKLQRLVLERGDAVAMLVHDTDRDEILLAKQLRIAAYRAGRGTKNSGLLVELPAGMIDGDERPADCARRELREELGVVAGRVTPIGVFYLSPGGSSERVHLFYCPVRSSAKKEAGGGLASEGEDIQTVRWPVSRLASMVAKRQILDAKTMVAVQWLLLQRPRQGKRSARNQVFTTKAQRTQRR